MGAVTQLGICGGSAGILTDQSVVLTAAVSKPLRPLFILRNIIPDRECETGIGEGKGVIILPSPADGVAAVQLSRGGCLRTAGADLDPGHIDREVSGFICKRRLSCISGEIKIQQHIIVADDGADARDAGCGKHTDQHRR